MQQLLDVGNNALTSVKSTDVIAIESILAASKAEAKALAPAGQEGTPVITARFDTLDETNRSNIDESGSGWCQGRSSQSHLHPSWQPRH